MAQGIFFPQQGEAMSLVIKIELSSKRFGPRHTDTGISINIMQVKHYHMNIVNMIFQLAQDFNYILTS